MPAVLGDESRPLAIIDGRDRGATLLFPRATLLFLRATLPLSRATLLLRATRGDRSLHAAPQSDVDRAASDCDQEPNARVCSTWCISPERRLYQPGHAPMNAIPSNQNQQGPKAASRINTSAKSVVPDPSRSACVPSHAENKQQVVKTDDRVAVEVTGAW